MFGQSLRVPADGFLDGRKLGVYRLKFRVEQLIESLKTDFGHGG